MFSIICGKEKRNDMEETWNGKRENKGQKRGNNRAEYEQSILCTWMEPLTGQSHTSSILYSGF